MKTILSYLKNVNTDSLTDSQKNTLIFDIAQEIVYQESFVKENFIEGVSPEGYIIHKVKPIESVSKQNKCSHGIPFVLAQEPCANVSTKKHNRDKRELYPEAFESSGDTRLFLYDLRKTLARFCAQWGVTGVQINEMWKFFMSNAKGTPNYFKKMYWRIHDCCQNLDKEYSERFFLTVTANPARFSKDIIVRYKQFSDRIGEFSRYMSRAFDAKLVVAIESTASLLPHAHIIIYTNEKQTDIKERYKRRGKYSYICGGKMRDCISHWWDCGFCELVRNKRQSTENYLAKYISKATTQSLKELLKKEKWGKSDVKEVATILLPVLACIRQFRLPKEKSPSDNVARLERVKEFSTETVTSPAKKSTPQANDSQTEIARLRAYLIALSIKSPISCVKRIVMAQYRAFTADFGDNFDEINQKSDNEKAEIAKKCKKVDCGGCLISRIIENAIFGRDFNDYFTDNSQLFESWLFRDWLGFFNCAHNKWRWAKDSDEQDIYIIGALRRFAHSVGRDIDSYEVSTMLSTHNSLWVSLLKADMLQMGASLISMQIPNLQQTQDSFKVSDYFSATFRKFLLRLSTKGCMIS